VTALRSSWWTARSAAARRGRTSRWRSNWLSTSPSTPTYTYDRRGRGDSGDTAPYAVEREVEDIEVLIEHAGGSAFLYGISSGAALALEAANRGLPTAKLALYEAPFVVDGSRPPVPRDYPRRLAELIASDRAHASLRHRDHA
jgi:alpha-beta hydrolase superfamily lysophospholipase